MVEGSFEIQFQYGCMRLGRLQVLNQEMGAEEVVQDVPTLDEGSLERVDKRMNALLQPSC